MNRNSDRSRPTPSPPSPAILLGILEPADVGHDLDARAVERDGRLVRVGEVVLATLLGARPGPGECARLPPATAFKRSVPLLPSRMTSVPLGTSSARGFDAGERRESQRARQDGDVRSRAAARGAKAHHPRAIERRGIRRREVFGDQDRCWADTPAARASVPVRTASTRRPTSRTSFARWASS